MNVAQLPTHSHSQSLTVSQRVSECSTATVTVIILRQCTNSVVQWTVHALSVTIPHSLTHSLTADFGSRNTLSFPHLLTHSLTHSLTHCRRVRAWCQPLTHSLTHSLTPLHSAVQRSSIVRRRRCCCCYCCCCRCRFVRSVGRSFGRPILRSFVRSVVWWIVVRSVCFRSVGR